MKTIDAQIILSTSTLANPNNGETTIINPTLSFFSKYMPTELSFSVTINAFIGQEVNRINILMEFFTDNYEELLFTLPNQDIVLPTDDSQKNISLNANINNLDIKNPGKYICRVTLNEQKYERTFYVFQQKGPDA